MHTPQYIADSKGNKLSVVLPIKEYQKLIEQLEDFDDIRLYDEAKKHKGESIPFEEYVKRRSKRKDG